MVNFLNNLALFWVKKGNFFADFGENILKIITSVPGHTARNLLKTKQKKKTICGFRKLGRW
jgi:hypothetical protein